jgi:predicted RNA binding protein YcfA (HicA-like mRNA interferase family)
LKVEDVIEVLRRDGWFMLRKAGSHRQFAHPVKAGSVTVPRELSAVLHPHALASVLRRAGI